MTSRNLGTFEISRPLIERDPEKVAEMLALMKFVPVRVEALFAQDSIEYTGISLKFPVVRANRKIPRYHLRITESKAGNIELVEIIPEDGGMEHIIKDVE